MRRRHVVVTGPMGAGKTTLTHAIARRLDWPWRDNDDDLERLHGTTGAVTAVDDGVDRLHELEARVLLDALDHEVPTVIAAAASVVDDGTCRERMGAVAHVVVVDPPLGVVVQRAASGRHRRDVDADETARLAEARRHAWSTLADMVLGDVAPADHLAHRVIETLGLAAD